MKPVELDLDKIPRRSRQTKAERGNMDRVFDRIQNPVRKTADWRRICRSLRCDGPQTVKALATNLGISKHWVDVVVNFYVKQGYIERIGRKYRLTEAYADLGKLRPRRASPPRKKKPTAWDKVAGVSDP